MANQRKENKRHIGGYVDDLVFEEMGKAGMDKTEFLEWTTVRGLMARGRLTAEKVRQLAAQDRIKTTTVLLLEQEGLLKK
jgi:hypothetical protein